MGEPSSLQQNVAVNISHRQILDYVTLAVASQTPMLAAIPKGERQTNPSFIDEWSLDGELDVRDSATVDGAPAGEGDGGQEKVKLLRNRLQWSRRVAQVNKLSGAQNQAGIGSTTKQKMGWAMAKAIEALSRDMEATLSSEREAVEGTSVDANKTRGALAFLTTTQTGAYAVPSPYVVTAGHVYSGAKSGFNEPEIQARMQAAFDSKAIGQGEMFHGLCGSSMKIKLSGLTTYASGTDSYQTVRTYQGDVQSKTLWYTVDKINGDFGSINLHPTHWLFNPTFGGTAALATNSLVGLCLNKWALITQEDKAIEELPFDGGSYRKQISSIWGLRCFNPLANFVARCTS
jgi:hypothetical protein